MCRPTGYAGNTVVEPPTTVPLGSRGRLGDHLLPFDGRASADFRVLRDGRKVRAWIDCDARDKRLRELPRDCAIAPGEVSARSIEASAPVP
jgi:hypothetical protein